MADLQKTIEIIFKGVDNLSDSTDKMSKSVGDLGKKMQDIGEPFIRATEKILELNVAILAIGAAAITSSANIDTETRKMQNSLGLPNEEAEKFREIALSVYTGGFGDNLTEAFEAATEAQKRFGDSAEVDIGKVTEQALTLQESFGTDYRETMSAVQTLMQEFGLTSEQAFDFVAAGLRKGLDGSGDFIESINEYSVQFSNGEATADQFFSVLETGMQNGVLGTDKAADAFKEFRVRIQDGSKLTKESLEAIGIDPAKLQANLNSGKQTVADAFDLIIQKISETDDKSVAFQAGVGLIGTQFEDMGQEAIKALDLSKTKLQDLQGTINSFKTDDLSVKFTSLFRTVSTTVTNSSIWDPAKSKLGEIFDEMGSAFGDAFDDVDFSGIIDAISSISETIGDIFVEADLDLTTVEGMKNAIQLVVNTIETLINVASGMATVFGPFITIAIEIIQWFTSLDSETQKFIGTIIALGSVMGPAGTALEFFGTKVIKLIPMLGPAGLAGAIGVAIGSFINQSETVQEATQSLIGFADSVLGITGAQKEQAEWTEANALTVDDYRKRLQELKKEADKIPEVTKKNIDVEVIAPEGSEVQAWLDYANGLITKAELEARIGMTIEEYEAKQAVKQASLVMQEEADNDTVTMSIEIDKEKLKTEEEALKEYGEKIEEIMTFDDVIIPVSAEFDFSGLGEELEKAEIEAKDAADIMKEAMKLQAEVDIAEIEAAARRAEAMFNSINTGLQTGADIITAGLEALVAASDFTTRTFIKDVIEEELRLREELTKKQLEAIDMQLELDEARLDRLRDRGEALITINADGLEPEIEAFMWRILQKIQIRAAETATEFLLGLG